MIRTFNGVKPRIHPTAYIHDGAEIIGRVVIGPRASIWPMAVLRGDVEAIRIGERSNIQDMAVVHARPGLPVVVGRGVTVGHSAVVHGSRIADGCLVGMGAVVMESKIGRECLIAAGAVVPKGLSLPARSLIMGFPAQALRALKPAELRHLRESAGAYVRLAQTHQRTSRVVY